MTEAERIDADRKRRERELLLLLLLFMGRTRRYAVHALKLGADPLRAMRLTWLGGEHFSGVIRPVAKAMAEAHLAGYERAAALVGGVEGNPLTGKVASENAPTMTEMTAYYLVPARLAAEQMLGTLQGIVAKALPGLAAPSDLRDVLNDAGYGVDAPTGLERAAEPPVVQAYGNGMAHAYDSGAHSGYRHVTVKDEGTTNICRARDGLKLPKEHPYWLDNWPMLHFGCRSIVFPVFGPQKWSESLPGVPPAPGWGRKPTWFGEMRTAA